MFEQFGAPPPPPLDPALPVRIKIIWQMGRTSSDCCSDNRQKSFADWQLLSWMCASFRRQGELDENIICTQGYSAARFRESYNYLRQIFGSSSLLSLQSASLSHCQWSAMQCPFLHWNSFSEHVTFAIPDKKQKENARSLKYSRNKKKKNNKKRVSLIHKVTRPRLFYLRIRYTRRVYTYYEMRIF